MFFDENRFCAAGSSWTHGGARGDSGSRTANRPQGTAREDDGPVHGSTPPHGDVLGHLLVSDVDAELEDEETAPAGDRAGWGSD